MNRLILILFVLIGVESYAQQLLNAFLEPSENPNSVVLHTTAYENRNILYLDHTINNQDNIIDFNLCYSNDLTALPVIDQREFEISLPIGFTDYTININFFTWDQNGICDYNNLLDTISIDFQYPYNPTATIVLPDDDFEGYLEYYDFGDDINNNDLVFTHRIVNISHLFMNENELNQLGLSQIAELTGIELLYRLKELRVMNNNIDFFDATLHPRLELLFFSDNPLQLLEVNNATNLEILYVLDTQISNVDLSQNSQLRALQLGSINVSEIDLSKNLEIRSLVLLRTNVEATDLSNNTLLESIDIRENDSLENLDLINNVDLNNLKCNENNALESINVGPALALNNLQFRDNISLSSINLELSENLINVEIRGNTSLTALDFSGNPLLETAIIMNNDLNYLNLRNGNANNLTTILATDNPDLFCVEVDDPSSAPYGSWIFDNEVNYSKECILGVVENVQNFNIKLYPNPSDNYLHIDSNYLLNEVAIYDVSGRLIETKSKILNNKIDIKNLEAGIYFLKFNLNGVTLLKRFIKE